MRLIPVLRGRDGDVCALCPVLLDFRVEHGPLRFVVIRADTRGGSEVANLRLAHRRCASRRAAGLLPDRVLLSRLAAKG